MVDKSLAWIFKAKKQIMRSCACYNSITVEFCRNNTYELCDSLDFLFLEVALLTFVAAANQGAGRREAMKWSKVFFCPRGTVLR